MTECDQADFRDMLPDYVAESLGAGPLTHLTGHLTECTACREEVALLRVARLARPQPVHVDVAAIVAAIVEQRRAPTLPIEPLALVPTSHVEQGRGAKTAEPRSIGIHPPVSRLSRVRRSTWQLAAAIGVVAIGSLSMYVARVGGLGLLNPIRADSAQLSDRGEGVAPRSTSTGGATVAADAASDAVARRAVVSVGDLSDYTDAELQGMLDRVEKWDGATSGEVMPTMPIMPGTGGGNPE